MGSMQSMTCRRLFSLRPSPGVLKLADLAHLYEEDAIAESLDECRLSSCGQPVLEHLFIYTGYLFKESPVLSIFFKKCIVFYLCMCVSVYEYLE